MIPSQSAETILSPCIPKIIMPLVSMRIGDVKTTYSDVEFARVDCIIVSVKSLDALTCANIPHCHCLVSTAASEDL